jgi:hypothetical protein
MATFALTTSTASSVFHFFSPSYWRGKSRENKNPGTRTSCRGVMLKRKQLSNQRETGNKVT